MKIWLVFGALIALSTLSCQELKLTPLPVTEYQLSRSTTAVSIPSDAPFGTVGDTTYAKRLWQSLVAEKLVGQDADLQQPFFGGAKPHGMILEVSHQMVSVGAHTGFAIIKKNYDGDDVSVEAVKQERKRFLNSITVMYRREAGYDKDNQNWFWVKYRADGTLYQKVVNGQQFSLAGRLMKGKTPAENKGCIYCHSSAGGGDYVFYPDIIVPLP